MWEVCHSDSFTGHSVHCKEDAHQTFESETKWQNGGWQDAHANCYTGCRSWAAHLHAQRCPVILSTSGTFLPLGQSCVYFQGAVFFPGPSWASERRLLAEIHVAQKARAFQLSVSNTQCQLVCNVQREIWRRKAAWGYKKPSSEFLWKATSLLVALARAGALHLGDEGFWGLHWKCLPQWFEVAKERKLMNAVVRYLLRARRKGKRVTDAGLKQHFRFFSLCLLSLEKQTIGRMTRLCGWLIISHPVTSHTPPSCSLNRH